MSNQYKSKSILFDNIAMCNMFARSVNGIFFIGVDCGGQKAIAKICDRNLTITGYCAGSGNPLRVGEKRAIEIAIGAITNAIAASGWTPELDEISGIVVGMPGIQKKGIFRSVLRQWNEDPLFGRVPVKFCPEMPAEKALQMAISISVTNNVN